MKASMSFSSTNWADDVDAEEAELGQPPLPADDRLHDRPSYSTSPSAKDAPIHHPSPLPTVPIPTAPPFKAHIGNVPFDIDEEIVSHFFRDLSVCDVIVARHRDSGRAKACFVEFDSQDDLKKALSRDGSELLRRPLRIKVAEPRRDGGGAGGSGGGSFRSRESGGNRERERDGGFTGRYREPNPRSSSDRWNSVRDVSNIEKRDTNTQSTNQIPSNTDASERPKLILKPRTTPIDSDTAISGAVDTAAAAVSKNNPFGNARPADTASKLLELEERKKTTAPPPPPELLSGGGGGNSSSGVDASRPPLPPGPPLPGSRGSGNDATGTTGRRNNNNNTMDKESKNTRRGDGRPPRDRETRGSGNRNNTSSSIKNTNNNASESLLHHHYQGDTGHGRHRNRDNAKGGESFSRGGGGGARGSTSGTTANRNSNAPKIVRANVESEALKTQVANPFELLADE